MNGISIETEPSCCATSHVTKCVSRTRGVVCDWNRSWPRSSSTLAFALAMTVCWMIGFDRQSLLAGETQHDGAYQVETAPGYVLLVNDHVIRGQAFQVGESIVVRKGGGSEIRLPRKKIACWAESLAYLYQYKIDHRSGSGFSVHLQDAQWCLDHELLDQATDEIEAAASKGAPPVHVNRLRRQWNRLKHPVARQADHWAVDKTDSQTDGQVRVDAAIQPTDFQRSNFQHGDSKHSDSSETVPAPIDQAIVGEFSKSIQLLLINRCANCHESESERLWKIAKPSAGLRPAARLTRENVVSAVEFVDTSSPDNSPLLIKATTPHGGRAAPLGPRHKKAIDRLERWITMVANQSAGMNLDPFPRPIVSAIAADADSVSVPIPMNETDRWPAPIVGDQPMQTTLPASDRGEAEPPRSWNARKPSQHPTDPRQIFPQNLAPQNLAPQNLAPQIQAPQIQAPQRMPQVEDPFDPELFNRQYLR